MNDRKFTRQIKEQAFIRASHRCQICANPYDLKCCYIHPRKLKYPRLGFTPEKWYNSAHIHSIDNCVVLCHWCACYINTKKGLQDVSVSYLESLNSHPNQCTAMVYRKGKFKRCSHRRADKESYRCFKHLD